MKNPKVAVVTGAARGIGYAISQKLKNEGFLVAGVDKSWTKRTPLNSYICDVSISKEVERTVRQIRKEMGEPSLLINNAGWGGPFHPLTKVSDREWGFIHNTNLSGAFYFMRALIPQMAKSKYGRIVNIASIYGLLGGANSVAYSSSKHGLIGLTRAAAAEWGARGITINAICPGFVDTAMGAQDKKVGSHRAKILRRTPAGRLGVPEEIADAVAFLVSDKARFVNGAALTIDGGLMVDVGL